MLALVGTVALTVATGDLAAGGGDGRACCMGLGSKAAGGGGRAC
jgi:hypothetical protein